MSRNKPAVEHGGRALRLVSLLQGFAVVVFLSTLAAAETAPLGDISIRYEIQNALDRALDRLGAFQKDDGAFGSGEDPAVTAWVLLAWAGDPTGRPRGRPGIGSAAGYRYLTNAPRTPEGLLSGPRSVSATALGVIALQSARDQQFDSVTAGFRRALLSARFTGTPGTDPGGVLKGGFSSGVPGELPGIESTQQVIRALYQRPGSSPVAGSTGDAESIVGSAAGFVWRCQVDAVPGTNSATLRPSDLGGFRSRPGPGTNAPALVSTCEGILAVMSAGTHPGDPRVLKAIDWIQDHYSITPEAAVPELARYRLYHTMAGVLSALRLDILRPVDGRRIDWRYDLVKRLLDLQEVDGHWGSDRLTPDERILATAQAAFALEIAFHALDH